MNLFAHRLSPAVESALSRVLEGHRLSRSEASPLAHASGADLQALVATADLLRERQVGQRVTYVVNRNINFTNVCIKHCGFCAFSRDHRTEEGYHLPDDEIMRRVQEAVELGATEVCIQAGLPPKMPGDTYVQLTRKVKSAFPRLHLHAFSPEEVLYGAIRSKSSVAEHLAQLKEAGLDSLPGTSAEILVQSLRDEIAPGRISVAQWLEVIRAAHALGLPTTSTMMFGFGETPDHWLQHMELIRDLQQETGGFTEFVPLGFVHDEAPMFRRGQARAGASGVEVLRVHALARVFLGQDIPNLQCSWVKEGPKLAQVLLGAGVNDLGGTLMNESISTAAGASFGQRRTPTDFHAWIRQAGRVPAQRAMNYTILKEFGEGEVSELPLDAVAEGDNRFGSYRELTLSDEHRFLHPNKATPATV